MAFWCFLVKSNILGVQPVASFSASYLVPEFFPYFPIIFSRSTQTLINSFLHRKTKSGNKFTVNFAPNEFAKNIEISLDGSKWDLSKKFAIGYKVTEAPGAKISSAQKQIVTLISLKNKYDGVYLLTGAHNRVPYNFPYKTVVYMMTAGANSVIYYWPDAGSYGHPIGVGPDPENDLSWYGPAISPVVEFDPNTDEVARVFNNPPNATVITKFTLAGVANSNRYDAATKKMYISWNYNGNPLRAFVDTLTFIKPRQ